MNRSDAPAAGRIGGPESDDEVILLTRRWLERAVIGLNLCPFAQSAYVHDRIRYTVCRALCDEDLRSALGDELRFLESADPAQWETTLLIHPGVLTDFLEYNQFLGEAATVLRRLGLDGVIQIASFHPKYQFAGTDPDDITNCTNRSPYPMLHLLRESSVAEAVSGPEDSARIVDRNIATLRKLGQEGWSRLNR